jgi:glutamyl-tRNA reductase
VTGRPPELARLLVVGANHRSGSVGIRDRLFFEESELPAIVGELCVDGIHEAFPIATCDRVEVLVACDDMAVAQSRLTEFFARRGGPDATSSLYAHGGEAAIRHLFRVTAALDSQILGEPQVLGQVKTAHRLLRDMGAPLTVIGNLLEKAYEVAKKVRNETGVAEGPVTIVAAAVRVARDLHGDLSETSLLVVGAGDAGELIAEGMMRAGIGKVVVSASRPALADGMAARLGAGVGDFSDLAGLLELSDIVVFAHGGREPVVDRDFIRAVLRRRRQKPMFLVDTSIPCDCAPGVGLLDSAFLYDLADLERLASDGLTGRTAAAEQADAIVLDAVTGLRDSRAADRAGEAIRRMHDRVEEMRRDVLEQSGGDAEKATRLLAGRFLNGPTAALRDAALSGREAGDLEDLIEMLFRSDTDERK